MPLSSTKPDLTWVTSLTSKQTSYRMSRVKSEDTGIERTLRSALHRSGLRFRKHLRHLPGRPDVVFPSQRVAVFVDGNFWHGYRLPQWADKLSDYWKQKIERNRRRDRSNFRKLRSNGWTVIRLWEHQIEGDLSGCVRKIVQAVAAAS